MLFAHGVGSVYESPIPVSLYLFGAAATVLISFGLRAFAPAGQRRQARRVAGTRVVDTLEAFSRAVALIGLVLAIVFAIISPERGLSAAPLLFWVGLVITTAVLQSIASGIWERADPWTTLQDLLGIEQASTVRPSPWWLTPVVVYVLFWFELVSGSGFDPLAIAIVLFGYTLYRLYLSRAFGDGGALLDPLAVVFGFAGRIAPFELRDEGLYYKGPLAGLSEDEPMTPALTAALFTLLGATTLDNLRETVEWNQLLTAIGLEGVPNVWIDTVALALLALPFAASFALAVWVATRWSERDLGLMGAVRRYAWSLIPIGIAYLLAHNMPLLISGLPQLFAQIAQEFGVELFARYVPSPQLVWFLEIALIVGGHVLGVVSAHRTAEQLSGSRSGAVMSHVALTVLMSAFTITTLWLLSLPLVTTA